MVYANDQWVQLPVRDLYDSQIMAMAINTAKDMYEKGMQEMKDFNKEYGSFMTPIAADQDWYNRNVTGRIRNVINAVYEAGGDPLRDPQARAMISRELSSLPYGDIAMLRSSAENAREYLKARRQLEMQGLYDPELAKYDGPNLSTYSTVGENGQGVWDKMSPTPIKDVATFGNPYFEGMKPNVHRESKNGIDYTVESITKKDLENVADNYFNELVSTPQGQLMFKRYRELAGGDSNPRANEEAREMFNKAIAAGQQRRTYVKDDYDDQWTKREQLRQGWAKINQDAAELALKRDQFNWEKDYYEKQLSGSGAGNATTDVKPAGSADQLAIDQTKQYVAVQDKYYKQLEDNEASSYNKLSKEEKNIANQYKKALDLLSTSNDEYKQAIKKLTDPNVSEKDKAAAREFAKNHRTTAEDKQRAQEFINKWKSNGSDALHNWMNSYEESLNKQQSWAKYSSNVKNSEDWGKPQNEVNLIKKAHESFQRQNIVNNTENAVDTGIQTDVNRSLSLIQDGDDQVGIISNGTEFSPITEVAMTGGGRAFKYNSKVNKINRLIQGKPYRIMMEDITGRQYGHGNIGRADYDVVQQTATFTDPAVVEKLNKYDESELGELGITKIVNNGTTVGYKIPITSKFSRGSQTWANINTETHKRIGGASSAVKNMASEQAASIMSDIK